MIVLKVQQATSVTKHFSGDMTDLVFTKGLGSFPLFNMNKSLLSNKNFVMVPVVLMIKDNQLTLHPK